MKLIYDDRAEGAVALISIILRIRVKISKQEENNE